MTKAMLLVTVLLVSLASLSVAGGKFVSATAGGTGDGTIGDPWTITQMNANLTNADTCYLRGGSYTTKINPVNSGTSGSWLHIIRYPGERPLWDGQANVADVSGNDYIEINGLYAKHITGDVFTIGKAGDGHYRFLYDTVYNLASVSGRCWYSAADVNGLSIAYGYYDRADTNGKTVTDGSADLLNVFGATDMNDVYIHHNYFARTGHSAINFKGDNGYTNRVVIRHNTFRGGRRCGPDFGNANNVLFEHNTMVFADSVSTSCRIGTAWQTVDYTSEQNIIRWNVVYIDSATITRTNSSSGCWSGSGFTGWSLNTPYDDETIQKEFFYHNTYDLWAPSNVAMEFAMIISANYDPVRTGDQTRPVRIKNNILVGLRTNDADEAVILQRDPNLDYADLDQHIAYNILNCTNSSDVTYITSTSESGLKSLSWAQTNYPSLWWNNGWSKPASWSHTNPSYELAATDTGVGDAGPLTTTNGGGSSSTSLVLTDLRYFTDGMGLVTGDTVVVVGMTPTSWASISAVNYGTNTATLNESRSWTTGSGVYAYKNGAQAVDCGAKQYVAAGETPPAIQRKVLRRI